MSAVVERQTDRPEDETQIVRDRPALREKILIPRYIAAESDRVRSAAARDEGDEEQLSRDERGIIPAT